MAFCSWSLVCGNRFPGCYGIFQTPSRWTKESDWIIDKDRTSLLNRGSPFPPSGPHMAHLLLAEWLSRLTFEMELLLRRKRVEFQGYESGKRVAFA